MFTLIRILLAANIIGATVTVPITVAGFGFGSGAGGSSFTQSANLASSKDLQTAAGIILKASCDNTKWNNKAEELKGPAIDKTEDIVKQAKTLEWIDYCKPNGSSRDEEGVPYRIGIQYKTQYQPERQAEEMQALFTGKWDRRTLLAITYLYQYRFAPDGVMQMSCEDKESSKAAPQMTIAVWESKYSGDEDDQSTGKDDRNVSPHYYGQAFDIYSFGCVKIKDKDGKIQSIDPNIVQLAQNTTPPTIDLSKNAIYDALVASGATSADQSLSLALSKFNSGSPVELASSLAGEMGPLAIVNGGLPAKENKGGLIGAIADLDEGKIESDLGAAVLERQIEDDLGVPTGSLENGVSDPEQIGAAALEKATGINPVEAQKTAGEDKGREKLDIFGRIVKAAGSFGLGISDSATQKLLGGDYKGASVIIGSDIARQKLAGQTAKTSNELVKALLSGGRTALKKKIDELDDKRRKDSIYNLNWSVFLDGDLSNDDIEAVKQYLDGFNEQDPKLAQGAKDGGVRNLSNKKEVKNWMQKNFNMTRKQAALAKKQIKEYEESSDKETLINEKVASYKDQIVLTAAQNLDGEDKELLSAALGGALDAKKLSEAYKNKGLDNAAQAVASGRLMLLAGLSQEDAKFVAEEIGKNGHVTSSGAIKKINDKYKGLNLSAEDFKVEGKIDFHNRPEAVDKAALFTVSRQLNQPVEKVRLALDSEGAAREELAAAYVKSKGVPSFAVDFATRFFKKKSDDKSGEDIKEGTKAAANIEGKDIANKTSPQDEEKKNKLENALKEEFDKAVDSAEEAGRERIKGELVAQGISGDDAAKLAKGNFADVDSALFAAAMQKSGRLDYNSAKKLYDGDLTESQKYSLADGFIASQGGLKVGDFNYALPNGFSEALVKGYRADDPLTAQDETLTRNDLYRDFGTQYATSRLVPLVGGLGIPGLDAGVIERVIRDESWGKLDGITKEAVIDQTAVNASQELLERSGGRVKIPPEKIEEQLRSGEKEELDEAAREAGEKDFGPVLEKSVESSTDKQTAAGTSEKWKSQENKTEGVGENKDAPAPENKEEKSVFDAIEEKAESYAKTFAKSAAANQVASMTGGLLTGDQVSKIYDLARENGLASDEMKTFGDDMFEQQFGFSRSELSDLDALGGKLKDKAFEPYVEMNFNQMATNMGAGIVVGTILGPTLMKMDPTGGLFAGFAMNFAATQLAAIAGPYLLIAAFIINPQAVMASVRAMLAQAMMIFTDPVGYLMGLFSMLDIGKKPKMYSSIDEKNYEAEKKKTIDFTSKGTAAPNKTEEDVGNKAKAAEGAGFSDVASQSPASEYLPPGEPTPKYMKQVALRSIDHIAEDLTRFSFVEKSDLKNVDDFWEKFMKKIDPPRTPYRVIQLIIPRILAEDKMDVGTDRQDFMYDSKEEGKGEHLTVSELMDRAQRLYGSGFDPLKASGRRPGILYSETIPDRVHVGF